MRHCSSDKHFIVPVIYLQIGLGSDVLRNILYFIDCNLEKLSTSEEVDRNKLVTVNQVISRRWQECQIWGANDGVILRGKYMQ